MSFVLRTSSALWFAGAAFARLSAPVTKAAASHPDLSAEEAKEIAEKK
jgi:hypothetical protein